MVFGSFDETTTLAAQTGIPFRTAVCTQRSRHDDARVVRKGEAPRCQALVSGIGEIDNLPSASACPDFFSFSRARHRRIPNHPLEVLPERGESCPGPPALASCPFLPRLIANCGLVPSHESTLLPALAHAPTFLTRSSSHGKASRAVRAWGGRAGG